MLISDQPVLSSSDKMSGKKIWEHSTGLPSVIQQHSCLYSGVFCQQIYIQILKAEAPY